METVPEPSQSATSLTAVLAAPEPVFNCPSCTLWLPPGTLVCPECHALLYARHLDTIARAALQLESQQKFSEARVAWSGALEWLPPETKQAANVQTRIDTIDQRRRAGEDAKARWTRRLGPLAPVVFFLMKAKTPLFALMKFKFLLSFFAFFGIYWALFGWRFGLGFTLLILVHEMGHYVQARRLGLKADMPVFLPGFGAYVRWYAAGVSLETLSGIALAGPWAGLLGTFVCLAVYLGHGVPTGSPASVTSGLAVFGALAHAGAWLNLANLTPVFGLDGAQATYALDRTQRILILAACILCFSLLHEAVYLFVAAGMAWRAFTGPVPARASTQTMVSFMLLLFTLGSVLWVTPDLGR